MLYQLLLRHEGNAQTIPASSPQLTSHRACFVVIVTTNIEYVQRVTNLFKNATNKASLFFSICFQDAPQCLHPATTKAVIRDQSIS